MKNVKIVIGASFGDEGKGLMTDYFASEAAKRRENCLVICSSFASPFYFSSLIASLFCLGLLQNFLGN